VFKEVALVESREAMEADSRYRRPWSGRFALAAALAILGLSVASAADFVSRQKPYQLDPEPNYKTYSKETVAKALTDQQFTKGILWTSDGSLGWKETRGVAITVDLGHIVPVESVAIRTARRFAAGVSFPYRGMVYLSADGERYEFVGDVVNDVGGHEGPYEERRFSLSGLGRLARYARLEIILRGRYFFTDEVEIVEAVAGTELKSTIDLGEIPADVSRRVTASRTVDASRRAMRALDRLGLPSGPDTVARRAAALAKRFPNEEFVIDTVNPLAHISPLTLPKGQAEADYKILIPQGSCDYRAFTLSNPASIPLRVRFTESAQQAALTAALFEAKPVLTASLETVFDPLVPVGPIYDIAPGETVMLWLKLCGEGRHTLRIDGSRKRFIATTDVERAATIDNRSFLASVVWAYPGHGMLAMRGDLARADLLAHHTSVAVIPPAMLTPYRSVDFKGFSKVIEKYTGVSIVLLFLDFRRNAPQLADPVWRRQFVQWYHGIIDSIRSVGRSDVRVFLYPYDEPVGEEIVMAHEVIRWMRSELAGVRLFATIDNRSALALVSLVDIACVAEGLSSDPAVVEGSKVWLYNMRGPGKDNLAYSYYRLMPWRAYARGFGGVGFWSYGDIYGSAWDDFDGRRPDFGVVYEEGNQSLLSSRRWEAWRLGLEDAALLARYASMFGNQAARRLAVDVISSPNDEWRATSTRRLVLESIKGSPPGNR